MYRRLLKESTQSTHLLRLLVLSGRCYSHLHRVFRPYGADPLDVIEGLLVCFLNFTVTDLQNKKRKKIKKSMKKSERKKFSQEKVLCKKVGKKQIQIKRRKKSIRIYKKRERRETIEN